MNLKTNYVDDKFEGKRKYQKTDNDDGTISLDDVTDYKQEGDIFGAKDINDVNKAVNDLYQFDTVVVPLSGWSISAPYIQTIPIARMTADKSPVVDLAISGDLSEESVKKQKKSWGYVDRIVSNYGSITLYCYVKKPVVDFAITIKGA